MVFYAYKVWWAHVILNAFLCHIFFTQSTDSHLANFSKDGRLNVRASCMSIHYSKRRLWKRKCESFSYSHIAISSRSSSLPCIVRIILYLNLCNMRMRAYKILELLRTLETYCHLPEHAAPIHSRVQDLIRAFSPSICELLSMVATIFSGIGHCSRE